nr:uncharacterized protein CTRU02_00547 [Colletotrichum truncatum]KAF6801798.1 hypothetical protein CTRU02_00547 [Colletotrichum truncatum]
MKHKTEMAELCELLPSQGTLICSLMTTGTAAVEGFSSDWRSRSKYHMHCL